MIKFIQEQKFLLLGLLLTLGLLIVGGQVSAADFTVSWDIPTTRTDNSAYLAAERGGTRIYYGTSSGSYANSFTVMDPDATTATITGVSPGTYYVTATAFDNANRESVFGNETTKVATGDTPPTEPPTEPPKPIAPPRSPSNVR